MGVSPSLIFCEESEHQSSITDLRRIAIDTSGKLGSLYDARQDRIIEHSHIYDEDQFNHQVTIVEGSIKYGNDEQPQNLFRQLSLDTHLTLSILLKLTSNEHIASIINYPYETNQQTRLLYYSQINRKQCLPDNNQEAIKSILLPEVLPNITTHIVTGIEFGLCMVVVLQLPDDAEKAKLIDKIVHKLLSILSENSDISTITQDEEILLNDIIHFKTYMNISFDDQFTTVSDVCRYIKQKAGENISYPIYYRLRPLKSLYPYIQSRINEFTTIPDGLTGKIEDFALLLLAKIKHFKTSALDKNSQELDFKEDELTKKFKELSNLVIEFRSGQDGTNAIEQLLNANEIFLSSKAQENLNDHPSVSVTTINETNNYNSNPFTTIAKHQTDLEIETINILLLGETGVGKSTFINAFANYLTFNSLQEAKENDPVVLMPVSFLITTGDKFDEHIVKFGNPDDQNNEDFQHPGQSVTQQCKSYEFTLKEPINKKICIIDTPGFGDTRGIDQDDSNMKNITDYINTLPHLNAVCLLLKPNTSRLNIFYRICLLQFGSIMKERFPKQKIIFCFTNSRSTFYTPGDTVPLLKQMLDTISDDSIFFKKENAFCFDSESFRYLVSLKNGIQFEELQENEFQMSWTKSVNESNRLIRYLFNNQ